MRNEVPTFVKWVGGKKQLLEQFKELYPKDFKNYHEPFIGGGAVGFYVLKHLRPKKAFFSDINEELINTYSIIKSDVDNLISELKKLKSLHNKETYYKVRSEDPKLICDMDKAARFIYLNKTCFNGLYRVNSKGGFNVPMGDSKNPLVCPEEDLLEINKLLKEVEISVASFDRVLENAQEGDFVYMDPPYYPLKKTSFTRYAKGDFLEKEQKELFEVFKRLDKRGCKVMLSNSDTEFIKELYKEYNIHFVKASRMVNSDGAGRGKINEVVVTNY